MTGVVTLYVMTMVNMTRCQAYCTPYRKSHSLACARGREGREGGRGGGREGSKGGREGGRERGGEDEVQGCKVREGLPYRSQ